MAISLESLNTAASSEVSNPTSRFGFADGVRPFNASDRTAGPIFAAQPQVRASPVNVFFLNKAIWYLLVLLQLINGQFFYIESLLINLYHNCLSICK